MAPSSVRARSNEVEREMGQLDRSIYAAVAATPTPLLDGAMRRLSNVADYSRLSLASAAVLWFAGAQSGRRAAASGLASLVVTSAVANLLVKPFGRRSRPDRVADDATSARQVRMPASRSFPSGHTACAVAFASGAGRVLPAASAPLHVLAAAVGYSRVHTGVHYPGDVVAGAVIGAVTADITLGALADRIARLD